jgi:hypothetical protein
MTPVVLKVFAAALSLTSLISGGVDADSGTETPKWKKGHSQDANLILAAPLDTYLNGSETCFLYERYVVVSESHPESVGTDIVVLEVAPKGRDAEGICARTGKSSPLLNLPNQEAEYFAGIWQHWLFVDSGTGNRRQLYVYDLRSRRKQATLEYDSRGFKLEKGALVDRDSQLSDLDLSRLQERPQCPAISSAKVPEGYRIEYRGVRSFDLERGVDRYDRVRCEARYEE